MALARTLVRLTILLAVLPGLVGCGAIRDTLGVGKKRAPDEMRVVARPPLSLPPNFNLRPPEPGAAPAHERAARDQAAQLLVGATAAGGAGGQQRSPGETALLQHTEALEADPEIRRVLAAESPFYGAEDLGILQGLMFWHKPDPGAGDILVDAPAERARLQRNQAEGRPVTDGATPIIERRGRGGVGLF